MAKLTRDNEEGISLKRLAEELHLSSSAVSLMVETLVQKDELERLHSARDRRMVLIRISPRGREELLRVRNALRQLMQDFLNDMEPKEQERAVLMLERLLAKVRAFSGQPVPRP